MKYRRRHHEIPADQGEDGGVAWLHVCSLARLGSLRRKLSGAQIGLFVFRGFSFPRGGDGFFH
jgi:hypothetical protein